MARGTKTGGRKAGTPNKRTAAVKEALEEAFCRLGDVPALVKWAKANPTAFYGLWVKTLPQQLKAEVGPLQHRIIDERIPLEELTEEELDQLERWCEFHDRIITRNSAPGRLHPGGDRPIPLPEKPVQIPDQSVDNNRTGQGSQNGAAN